MLTDAFDDDGKTWFEFTKKETEQLRKIQERIGASSLSEVLSKVIDLYDRLTSPQSLDAIIHTPTLIGMGCICPMGANNYCENPICPRKNPLNQKICPA